VSFIHSIWIVTNADPITIFSSPNDVPFSYHGSLWFRWGTSDCQLLTSPSARNTDPPLQWPSTVSLRLERPWSSRRPPCGCSAPRSPRSLRQSGPPSEGPPSPPASRRRRTRCTDRVDPFQPACWTQNLGRQEPHGRHRGAQSASAQFWGGRVRGWWWMISWERGRQLLDRQNNVSKYIYIYIYIFLYIHLEICT